MTTVRRDPFTREELVRHLVKTNVTCNWCGQHRLHKDGKRKPSMFSYEVESDGGRRFGQSKVFCSISCYDSYFN